MNNKLSNSNLLNILGSLITKCKVISKSDIVDIKPIEGDASTRLYWRATLNNSPITSVVLTYAEDKLGPLGGGTNNLSQMEAFIQIRDYFASFSLPVPTIYAHTKENKAHYMLLEDFGDQSLAQILIDSKEEDKKELYLNQAIEFILKLQKLPHNKKIICYQKTPVLQKYKNEALEFLYYILNPLNIKKSILELFTTLAKELSLFLMDHPKALSHFDFHSHNILVQDNLCKVIDFQDAALISPARDFVSLLNDRCIDKAIGEKLIGKMLEKAKIALPYSDNDFDAMYYTYLLHWDLRVSGRFAKFVYYEGRKKYKQWLQGTINRVTSDLLKCSKLIKSSEDFYQEWLIIKKMFLES